MTSGVARALRRRSARSRASDGEEEYDGLTPIPPAIAALIPVAGLVIGHETARTPTGAGPVPSASAIDVLRRHAARDDVGGPVLRRKWDTRSYQVSGTDREMLVEQHDPQWGAAGPPAEWVENPQRPRSILFETMGTIDNIPGLVARLGAVPAPAAQDVGLSVVLNGPWTPANQFEDDGTKTGKKTPPAPDKKSRVTDVEGVKKYLTTARQQLVANWNGPPLQIITAAWERRSRAQAEGAKETVQSSVPYTTLRVLAATNPGARTIAANLEATHQTLWHKMGDDDMPLFDPNQGFQQVAFGQEPTDELGALAAAEEAGIHSTTVVTFGYDLTTNFLPKTQTPVGPDITAALQSLYRVEMDLRNWIRDLGAPIYPSEPTSFYRTVKGNDASSVWKNVEDAKAGGGSGQQLEGAKLVLALSGQGGSGEKNPSGKAQKDTAQPSEKRNLAPQKTASKSAKGNAVKSGSSQAQMPEMKAASGIQQLAYHTVQVATSAGGRNDSLVRLLHGWLAGGNVNAVSQNDVVAEINKLDQCALKHGEYLDKVFQKLPKPSGLDLTAVIARQVDAERTRAAQGICAAIQNAIRQANALQAGAQQAPVQGPAQGGQQAVVQQLPVVQPGVVQPVVQHVPVQQHQPAQNAGRRGNPGGAGGQGRGRGRGGRNK